MELIDKRAALACFHDWTDRYGDVHTADEIPEYRAIEELPSAQPERKHGEWLDGHRAGYGESLYWYIYCSECLYERDDDDHDKDTPFCPNCGCQMGRGTDEH